MTYTVAAHNMYHKLSPLPWKWRRDLKKSSQADITVYCEAQKSRSVLERHCQKYGRDLHFAPTDVGNPISWDDSRVNFIPGTAHTFRVHENMPGPSGARGFTTVGLKIRNTGRKVLVVSVHADNGYAKDEKKTTWGKAANKHKNWSAKKYWLEVLSFVALAMSTEAWDDIVIAGDFNAHMSNFMEWYFPAVLLGDITRKSKTANKIDHILVTVDSKSNVENVRRLKGWTDHPILVATLS